MSKQSPDERPPDVVESIPWDSLARPEPPDRRTWFVLAAVAVAVAAISASATRTLWPAPPLAAPTSTLAPSVSRPATATPMPEPLPAEAPTTTIPPMISEADLMAADPSDVERWVASHAEWFLTELFTFDGTDRATLATLLPVGLTPPAPPPDARSYVESVITTSVISLGDGRHRVTAVVRRLSAIDGGTYVRQDPVTVSVGVGIVDGAPAVLDLPTPEPMDVGRAVASPGTPVDPPAGISGAASELLAGFGTVDPSSIAATLHGAIWRVSADVRDAAGIEWPLAVWLDADGHRVSPPAPHP